MGDFAERIGAFDDDIGIFTGGIGRFKVADCDSGADKMMECFAHAGLTRATAEAIWDFCEKAGNLAVRKDANALSRDARTHSHPMFPAMLAEAVAAPLPRMHLRILRVALGWADIEAESMRAIARDYQYSPEQISNLVEAIQVKYSLPPNQFNKSAAAIKRYAGTNGK